MDHDSHWSFCLKTYIIINVDSYTSRVPGVLVHTYTQYVRQFLNKLEASEPVIFLFQASASLFY
jgi:hypothetical protein